MQSKGVMSNSSANLSKRSFKKKRFLFNPIMKHNEVMFFQSLVSAKSVHCFH